MNDYTIWHYIVLPIIAIAVFLTEYKHDKKSWLTRGAIDHRTGIALWCSFLFNLYIFGGGIASLGLVGLRIALFDTFMAKVKGLPVWYMGKTAKWDKFIRKVFRNDTGLKIYLGMKVAIGVLLVLNFFTKWIN